ncbi:hypothetical protein M9H77_10667 [Catharanthus roseus]|uniref:Uncharacterized protein n=1 Tax=Catharanthus roseus TaxID=4058 RepID=A0ACC0BCG1_CATRO|nr:hypothetical protein M9H77_10667 [Catharanthus roseus]
MPTNAELNSTLESFIKDYEASKEQQKSELLGLRIEVQAIKSNIQEFKGSMEDMKAMIERLSTYGFKSSSGSTRLYGPAANKISININVFGVHSSRLKTQISSRPAALILYSLSDVIHVATQIEEDILVRSSHKVAAQNN